MFSPTHISSSAPTVNDDFSEGFRPGVFWWDTSANRHYLLEDDAEGAADWKSVSGGAIGMWADWTPSYSWTGGTPGSVVTVARYIILGKICYITLQVDGSGSGIATTTDMSCTLPAVAAVVDNNSLVPLDFAVWIDGSDWERNNMASVNSVTDPAKITHENFVTIPTGTDFKLCYAGHYETE